MRSPLLRNTHPSESPGWSTRVRENLAQLIAPSGQTPSSSNGAPIHLLKSDRTGKAGPAQMVSLLTHAGILAALLFLAHGQLRKIIGDAPLLPPHGTPTFERPADLTSQRVARAKGRRWRRQSDSRNARISSGTFVGATNVATRPR
jgi:hypothetical protein